MLIQTPPKQGDAISLKLISGEELIARLEESDGNTVTLVKPMSLIMGPQGFGLAPYMMSAPADSKITIPTSAIVAQTKTADEIAKQYIKQTTGIQLA